MKCRTALFLLAVLAIQCSVYAQDDGITWQADSGKGFFAGLNLAQNFDGKRVDAATGIGGKAWAMVAESVNAVSRTVADTAVYAWNHPIRSAAVLTVAAVAVSPDLQEKGQELIDKVRGKEDDEDRKEVTKEMVQDKDLVVQVDGNGNKFYYEYGEDGSPTIVWIVDGDNNEFTVKPMPSEEYPETKASAFTIRCLDTMNDMGL